MVEQAADVAKGQFSGENIIFRVITLSEPPKKDLIPYLEAERTGTPLPAPPARLARLQFYLGKPTEYRSAKVDLAKEHLFDLTNLNAHHAYVDTGQMKRCEEAALADPRVQAAINDLQLPEGAKVVCEPWTYSPDGMNDMVRRIVMV